MSNSNTVSPFDPNVPLTIGVDINMNDNKIVNIGDPVNPKDAVNKNYVDVAVASGGSGVTKLGLGMTGETWHDVTSSRIPTTTDTPSPNYNNLRTYPIMVTIYYTPTDNINAVDMFMSTKGYNIGDNRCVARTTGGNIGQQTTLSTIILPNERYWPGVWGGTYDAWFELY